MLEWLSKVRVVLVQALLSHEGTGLQAHSHPGYNADQNPGIMQGGKRRVSFRVTLFDLGRISQQPECAAEWIFFIPKWPENSGSLQRPNNPRNRPQLPTSPVSSRAFQSRTA